MESNLYKFQDIPELFVEVSSTQQSKCFLCIYMHLSSRNLWLIHRFISEIWWFWLIYSPEKLEFVLHAWCCQKGGPREQAFAEPYGNPSECVKVWSEGITFGPTEVVTLRTTLWSNLYLNCRSRHWNAAAILPVLPMAAKHIQTISKYCCLLNVTNFHLCCIL